jgi:hypothetical protein
MAHQLPPMAAAAAASAVVNALGAAGTLAGRPGGAEHSPAHASTAHGHHALPALPPASAEQQGGLAPLHGRADAAPAQLHAGTAAHALQAGGLAVHEQAPALGSSDAGGAGGGDDTRSAAVSAHAGPHADPYNLSGGGSAAT